jgi:hypothetical protein
MAKLKLLIDSYDQPQKDDDPRGVRSLKALSKGDIFEPVNQAEADRLKEIGAALDPKEAAEQARSDAAAEAQRLRDQAAALEAEADAAEAAPDENALSSLTVPELDQRLADADLPKTGTKDEKVARLQEASSSQG